jgi:hypothetical protein
LAYWTNTRSMTRSAEDRKRVADFIASGRNDCQIARLTGIPRSTISEWRRRPRSAQRRGGRLDGRCPEDHDPPHPAYAYLLGAYLGDGCISRHPRTYRIRLCLDTAYPGIIEQCATALEVIRPGKRAWRGPNARSRYTEVSMYWNHWPCLFPQHGRGKKHLRPIVLAPWQGSDHRGKAAPVRPRSDPQRRMPDRGKRSGPAISQVSLLESLRGHQAALLHSSRAAGSGMDSP